MADGPANLPGSAQDGRRVARDAGPRQQRAAVLAMTDRQSGDLLRADQQPDGLRRLLRMSCRTIFFGLSEIGVTLVLHENSGGRLLD